MRTAVATLEKIWLFTQCETCELPYDPVTSLLGVYLKEIKIYIHKNE